VLVARAPSVRGGACCVYACWEWGCLRVSGAWGRLGLIRRPPYGSRHLHDRTLTHPPTVLPASHHGRKPRRAHTLGVDRGRTSRATNTSCVTESLLARFEGLEATLTPRPLIPSVPLRPSENAPSDTLKGPSENPPKTPSQTPAKEHQKTLPSGHMGAVSAEGGPSFGHRLE